MKRALARMNLPRTLLLSFALLAIGTAGAIVATGTARAANYNISYQQLLNKVGDKPAKFCSELKGNSFYNDCVTAYNNGVANVYYASSLDAAHKQIQSTCTPPEVSYPPSNLHECDAFATGSTVAENILKSHKTSSGGNNNNSNNNSNNNNSKNNNNNKSGDTSAPPISDCDKAKKKSDRQTCKKKYRKCNKTPYSLAHIAACKRNVINKYTSSSSSGSGSGSSNNKGDGCSGSSCSSTPTGSGKNCDKDKCDLVALYINPLIKVLSIIVGLVVAASLVLGGVQYSAAGSDPQKVSAAKSRITNTLMAFLAYAFLFAFLNFLVPGGLF